MYTPEMYANEKRLLEENKKASLRCAEIAGKKEKLSADETAEFERVFASMSENDARIEMIRKADKASDLDIREKELAAAEARMKNPVRPAAGGADTKRTLPKVKRNPLEDDHQYDIRCRRQTEEYMRVAQEFIIYKQMPTDQNMRALFAQQDVSGGYLVLPEVVSNKLLKAVDNHLWMMKKATIFRLPRAMSIGLPSLENNPASGDWTTEIATVTADTAMSFGKRLLAPTPIRKMIKVSERFIRMALDMSFWSEDDSDTTGPGGDPIDIVVDRMGYMIAYTMEQAFYLGTGVGQPLGMYVASANGVPTSRDVQTGSTTNFTHAGLINTKVSLKQQYWKDAQWDFSRTGVGNILKLVDSQNRPLLDIKTIPGELPQLIGHPVQISEFTPSTFTTGLYVGMFFNPKYYAIGIAQDFEWSQANELYKETAQVGIFAGAEADGMPALAEAYARMILN